MNEIDRNPLSDTSRREAPDERLPEGTAPMTLDDARKMLEAEVIVGADLHKIDVLMGCGADLMSDVLAFAKTGALLLTGLTNIQVIRTVEMANIVGICFVRGKKPPEETVSLAVQNDLPLLATDLPMFESCGRLYHGGLKGCSETAG